MNRHDLTAFLHSQLEKWPVARSNYASFRNCVTTRMLKVDGFDVEIMFNPARVVSTCAKVDKQSINKRPCFLCASNRPLEQEGLLLEDENRFEILVNPFPLAPLHFTIASKNHEPQSMTPLGAMTGAALKYPGLVFFYNGANAGASAPDHLHFQCIEKNMLPFCNNDNFPYLHKKFVVHSVNEAERLAADDIFFSPLQNVFVWSDNGSEAIIVYVPRKCHRPSCYYESGENRLCISPGAVDVAGRLICVREEDYNRINEEKIKEIFKETLFYER